MKSVLVDFLVGAGIKPTSIVSYNHLGNNDGMNLSAPQTFRSKEISKSNVVRSRIPTTSQGICETRTWVILDLQQSPFNAAAEIFPARSFAPESQSSCVVLVLNSIVL